MVIANDISLSKAQFTAKISKGPGGGYRIGIPKHILERLPDDLWVFDTVYIRSMDGFKQVLKNVPCSRSNEKRRYIPIYLEYVETSYDQLGQCSIELIYKCPVSQSRPLSYTDFSTI